MKGVEHYGIAKEFAQLLDGVPYKAHGVLFTRDPLVETYRPMMLWELRRDGDMVRYTNPLAESRQFATSMLRKWMRAIENLAPNALADRVRASDATSATPKPTRTKRSTRRGDGRAKLIAALTKHHKYADGDDLYSEPIGNNELARIATVDPATASAFFLKQFKGHDKYKAVCKDATLLAAALKMLNGEFAPHCLYGSKPANERERGEE